MKATVLKFKMPYWLLLVILLDFSHKTSSIPVGHDEHSHHHHEEHQDVDHPHVHHEESNHDKEDSFHGDDFDLGFNSEDSEASEEGHTHDNHEESHNHDNQEESHNHDHHEENHNHDSLEEESHFHDNPDHDHQEESHNHDSPDTDHEESHDHHEHHDQDSVDGHSVSNNEFTIKSYKEDCLSANVKCSDGEHLVCDEDLGKCDCPRGMVYHSGKCETAPHPVEENSLENDEEINIELTIDEDDESPTPTPKPNDRDSNKLQGDTHDHDGEEEQDNKQARSGIEILENLCQNVDCEETLGKYSACDENTGECICKDVEQGTRPLRIIDGKCWINRGINDPCKSHEECNATITGNAWCHLDLATRNRFCQCEMYNYFDESLGECLELARDGLFSPCKTDLQCTGSKEVGTGYGPNAECSQESNVCQCKLGPDNQNGFLHMHLCVYEMKMGDACTLDRECEITLPDKDVFCSPATKTCSCREGNQEEDCKKKQNLEGRFLQNDEAESEVNNEGLMNSLKSAIGLDVPNFVFITIIIAVVVLILVILSVFIAKKRHKYSVVKTREQEMEDPKL
ncbi:hypothetical protein Ocin01_12771 [Orchesella cincta]|uniref:EGF-like domain-containing protein n=1 Tax=Orchesella cincta TaxID=48709 RepID=A0A1D2MLN5_ORCCI|nr:hypothetical protein Ocin01_12771 [Orchesella cincta]